MIYLVGYGYPLFVALTYELLAFVLTHLILYRQFVRLNLIAKCCKKVHTSIEDSSFTIRGRG